MKEIIEKIKKYFLSPYKRRSLELRNKSKYLLYVNFICSGFLIVVFFAHLFVREGNFIILGQLFGISLLTFSFYLLRIKKITMAGNFTSYSLISFCFFSFIISDYYHDSINYLRIYESLSFILVGLTLLSLFAITKKQILLFSILAFFILLLDFSVIFYKLDSFPDMYMWFSMSMCLIIFVLCSYLANLILYKSKELIKIAERESVKSKLKYQSLFKNIDDGFLYSKLIFDSSGKAIDAIFTEANTIFENLCGYKKVDIIGKKLSNIYPEIRAFFDDWELLLARMGEGNHTKFTIYNKYNKIWSKVQAYSPQEGYFVLLVDDITGFIDKDNSLVETHEKYNAIINNISEGIIVFENDLILEINNTTENLLGFGIDEIKGKPITEVVADDDYERFSNSFINNETHYVQIKLNKKDSSQIPVNISGKVLSLENRLISMAIIK